MIEGPPVEEAIEAFTAAGPARTFEDVPISLCLYPWVHPDGTGARIRYPGQRRDGYRWGLSATWDGETPHYMLPASALAATPLRSSLHLTAHPVFDFVLDAATTIERLDRNQRTRQAARRYRIEEDPAPVEEMLEVLGAALGRIGAPHPSYAERYDRMLRFICRPGAELPVRFVSMLDGRELAGFSIIWQGVDVDFAVFTYAHPDHLSASRLLWRGVCAMSGRDVNAGDAHRLPGLARFKLDLRPARLEPYFNALDREEEADYEQPR